MSTARERQRAKAAQTTANTTNATARENQRKKAAAVANKTTAASTLAKEAKTAGVEQKLGTLNQNNAQTSLANARTAEAKAKAASQAALKENASKTIAKIQQDANKTMATDQQKETNNRILQNLITTDFEKRQRGVQDPTLAKAIQKAGTIANNANQENKIQDLQANQELRKQSNQNALQESMNARVPESGDKYFAEKPTGGKTKAIDVPFYLAGMTTAGAADALGNIQQGADITIGDILAGGKRSNEYKTLAEYFNDNPAMEKQARNNGGDRALENFTLSAISKATGVDQNRIKTYLQNTESASFLNEVEDTHQISDALKNSAGQWAYSIGQQLPGIALTAGAGAGAEKLSKAVTLGLMTSQSYGGKLADNAEKYGFRVRNYGNALVNAAIETGTELIDDFVPTADAILKVVTPGQLTKNALGEGLEEAIGYPLEQIADYLLLPHGEEAFLDIFDMGEWIENFTSGAVVGGLMGSTGALLNVAAKRMSGETSLQNAASVVQRIADTLPGAYRPTMTNIRTEEELQEYMGALTVGLREYAQDQKAESRKHPEHMADGATEAETQEAAQTAPAAETQHAQPETQQPTAQPKTQPQTARERQRAKAAEVTNQQAETNNQNAERQTETNRNKLPEQEAYENRQKEIGTEQEQNTKRQAQIELLGRQLKQGIISEEDYDAQVDELLDANGEEVGDTDAMAQYNEDGSFTLRGMDQQNSALDQQNVEQSNENSHSKASQEQNANSQKDARLQEIEDKLVKDYAKSYKEGLSGAERTESNYLTDQESTAAYQEGQQTAEGKLTKALEVAAQQAEKLESNGAWPAETNAQTNSQTEQEDNHGVLLHESSQRESGESASRQTGSMAERAGEAEGSGVRQGNGSENRGYARFASAQQITRATSADLLENGSSTDVIGVIPKAVYETESNLNTMAYALNYMGITPVFVTDNLHVWNSSTKKMQTVEAANSNGMIILSVLKNGKLKSVDELSRVFNHELYHSYAATDENLVRHTWEALKDEFGADTMQKLLQQTVKDYMGIYGTEEEDMVKYQEELIADLYAGMKKRTATKALPEETYLRMQEITQNESGNIKETLEDVWGERFTIADTLDEDLQAVLDNTFASDQEEIYIGETSNFLTDTIGADALSVTMPATKAYSAMATAEEASQQGRFQESLNYHGLGKDGLLWALEASENPVAAFADTENENGKRENNIVLVTDKTAKKGADEKRQNIVVVEALNVDGNKNGKRITANKIITTFDRAALQDDILHAAADGRLLYLDKKRSQNILAGVPAANSPTAIRESDFKNNIRNFWANVNWEKSGRNSFTSGAAEQETEIARAYRKAQEKKNRSKSRNTESYSIAEEDSSETDEKYLQAVREGNTELQQQMVDEAARSWGAMKNGYDGGWYFYHGTNSDEFTVFDKSEIGSANDSGFFGRGFYFAYTRAEARYYGRNIKKAFLRITNPFNFRKELYTLNGKKSATRPDIDFIINYAKKFPQMADEFEVEYAEKGSDEVKTMSYTAFAELFMKYYDSVDFKVEELQNEDNEYVVVADKYTETFESYDGQKHTFTDYRFKQRVWGQDAANDRVMLTMEYLKKIVFDYIDTGTSGISGVASVIMDSPQFADELKKMGYDGVIQSEDGDEAVVFEPEQIKSADPVTYDDDGNVIPLSERFNRGKTDIRYSMADEEDAAPFASLSKQGQKDVRKAAEAFRKEILSVFPVPKSELRGKVWDAVNDYLETGSMNDDLFDWLYENAEMPDWNQQQDPQYQEAWDYLKGKRIYVSKESRDSKKRNDQRRSAWGKVFFTNNPKNQSLDSVYSELKEMVPGLVAQVEKDGAATGDAQVQALLDIIQTVKPATQNLEDYARTETNMTGEDAHQGFKMRFDRMAEETARKIDAAKQNENDRNQAKLQKKQEKVFGKEIVNDYARMPEPKESIRATTMDKITSQGRDIAQRAENKQIRGAAYAFDAPYGSDREYLTATAREITDEYLENGEVPESKLKKLYERDYETAQKNSKEYLNKTKELRNVFSKTKLEDRNETGNAQRIKEQKVLTFGAGGISVSNAYRKAQNILPEFFPDTENREEQLKTLYQVASGIQSAERMQNEGKDEKKWRWNDWNTSTMELLNSLNKARRLNEMAMREEEATQKKPSARKTTADGREAPAYTKDNIDLGYQQMKVFRRELEKAKALSTLTSWEMTEATALSRGQISKDQITGDKATISMMADTIWNYESAMNAIKRYNAERKQALRDEADEFLKDADKLKDKKLGLAYSTETLERNIRDVFKDKNTADKMVKRYVTSYKTNEAKRIRFANEMRQKVKDLNLSRKVNDGDAISEAHAVQLLGEAQDAIRMIERSRGRLDKREGKTLQEWDDIVKNIWAENPSLDKAKIQNAVQTFRNIYDDLLKQMNQARTENGYEPIDYRSGYFPHFQPGDGDGILQQFAKSMGMSMDVTALPTSINGKTKNFKPGIRWIANALERIGYSTVYDAVEGFDKYIEGVSDVIYHTNDIQAQRALANQIRYRTTDESIQKQIDEIKNDPNLTEEERQDKLTAFYQDNEKRFRLSHFVVDLEEHINHIANKKSSTDRSMEEMFGRNIFNVVKAAEGRVAANMVAINPGSWLTNFIPISQAWATTSSKDIVAGMVDTLKAMAKGDTSFIQQSDFLTNRRGTDLLVPTYEQTSNASERKQKLNRVVGKTSEVLSAPMEIIDNFTSEAIVRARYRQNMRQNGGVSETALMEADAWASDIMADRSKGAQPTIFNAKNPLVKALTMFQLEVNNELRWVAKDLPRMAGGDKKKLAAVIVKFLLGAWLYDQVYEFFTGRKAALDPIDILNDTVGDVTGYQLPNVFDLGIDALQGEASLKTNKESLPDALTNLTENVSEELPFIGGLLGGGRIPISSAIPDGDNLKNAILNSEWSTTKRLSTLGKEIGGTAGAYLLLPFGGGQVKKIWQTVQGMIQGGIYSYDKDGNRQLKYPMYEDSAWDAAATALRGGIFGPTQTEGGREWIDNGFGYLNATRTAVYEDMRNVSSDRESWSIMQQLSAAEDPEAALKELNANEDAKAIYFYGLLASDSEREIMDDLTDSGEDPWQITEYLMDRALAKNSQEKRQSILNSGLTGEGKLEAYAQYLDEDSKELEYINSLPADADAEGTLEALCALKDANDAENKSQAKRDALRNSDLTDEAKLDIYTTLVSTNEDRNNQMETMLSQGMDFDDIMDAQDLYSSLSKESGSASEKATTFSAWVDRQDWSAKAKDTVKDSYGFYSQMRQDAERYESFKDKGLSTDEAEKLDTALRKLEPENGKTTVSELQKLEAVNKQKLTEKKAAAAFEEIMSETTYEKFKTAQSYGVTTSTWTKWKRAQEDADADGNGSLTQKEAANAIRSLYGLTPSAEETKIMATLWQLTNKSWKSKNNPFDTSVGQTVYNELNQ